MTTVERNGTTRDPALERELLRSITARAARYFRVDCAPYVRRVELRLRLGAQRYGDNLHDGRDLIGELLEETPDLAGYALLILQAANGTLARDVRDDLLRVTMLGAVADFYARRVARRLRAERRDQSTGARAR